MSLPNEIIVERPLLAEDLSVPSEESARCKLVLDVDREGGESGRTGFGGCDSCITGCGGSKSGSTSCDGCESGLTGSIVQVLTGPPSEIVIDNDGFKVEAA